MKFEIKNLGTIGILILIALGFTFIILGYSGMMTVLGAIVLFIVPIYLILDKFKLDQDEKLVFSFFIGVGVFPSLVYWPAIFISFRLSVVLSFVLLVVVAILFRKFKK